MSTHDNSHGEAWEKELADLTKSRRRRDSGQGWKEKLDTADGRFVYSAKSTMHESFRVDWRTLAELERHTKSIGGHTDKIGVLAVYIRGIKRKVVVLDLDDFLALTQEVADDAGAPRNPGRRPGRGLSQLEREANEGADDDDAR